ncbi:MAG: conjugal transfer protein [Azoarcus sp.]|nr:MAG: conjugal transfer protein [Azoarcus sp.]TVT60047.1 MAG: conjugal transfer protein [Azoarcus sp. PHD]
MNRIWSAFLLSAFAAAAAMAAEVPEPGERDARIRFVTYKKDEVTTVTVRRGAVTRIVLGDDERISVAATGFTADCQKAELEWCVVADVGTNQIWVKPKDNATHNNLELKTGKRDYSFEFKVLPDADGRGRKPANAKVLEAEPMFRVIFRYPVEIPSMAAFMAVNAASAQMNAQAIDKATLEDRLDNAKPVARNWKYSMQTMEGSDEIAPSIVFDDGRFTYFRFPANREIPTLYYISPTGEESRINYHMEGDLAVVQRMGRRFVLRLGQAVVGVWNDAYDADGVAAKDGTTIDGVIRTIR